MSDEVAAPGRRQGSRKWRFALLGVALLASVATLLAWTSTGHFQAFGAAPTGSRLERMRASPRNRDGVFVNTTVNPAVRNRPDLGTLKELAFGSQQRTPPGPLPMERDVAAALAKPPESGLRVTWLGHSTMLVELDGFRILTDPVWGERASPSTLVGPQRFHPPPLPLDALPDVDAVLLSHDHYDHLDMPTIQAMVPRGWTFYVPLGLGAHLEQWGVPPERVVELDWWQEVSLGDGRLRMVSTPAQHFSGRGLSDRNRTLWTSWTLLGPQHRVFFSGDTGLTQEFAEVGRRFGPFDLAMFEVGAFHPSWGDIHLGPHQALQAHELVRGRRLLPIHWGTFSLAIHAWDEPAEVLAAEARKQGVALVTPRLGHPVELTGDVPSAPWWREVRAP
ncbi:MBL fold metallo-hydrolase [Pyxidicoccus trucidator]|uniref:MBL fold metallo-hydrolase n=1 Tax=Pyxidicoccus trucidator TaxID=2709662 RepID=UPI0013DA5A6E|nr:MBL fold metallo-hydrolase [Pyxidicoccus trucidator]